MTSRREKHRRNEVAAMVSAAVSAARARAGRRYLVVATARGRHRHMMVVWPGYAPAVLCGANPDATRTRRLLRAGRGTIALPDCFPCSVLLRHPKPAVGPRDSLSVGRLPIDLG